MIFNFVQDYWVILLTLGIYFLSLINCYRLLEDRRSPAATISWLWAHLTLPFFAVPIYWFIGRVRIKDYISPLNLLNLEFDGYAKKIIERENIDDFNNSHLNQFKLIFKRFGPVFSPHQNQADLLIDGEQTFEEIFSAIRSANHYILVQYYIIQSDKLGLELKELLIEKAKSGVKVYLLYDDMGSFWLSKNYIKDLKKAGVKISRFLPVFSLKRPFLVNFRNHRKLVVVDGLWGFTGGLNVGEEYIGSKFKKTREWRDTHLKLAGPAVRQLEEVFIEDWCFAENEKIVNELEVFRGNAAKDEIQILKSTKDANVHIQVIPSGPIDHVIIGMLLYLQIIHSAKKRIWIATPYFIPDESLQQVLELAVLRGVDVRVLIPLKSDNRLVHWATLSYAEQLQKHGVKIYLYEKGFTHQKIILVDDDLSGVGTSNFDNRAMYLNFETTILAFDKNFASKVESMLLEDFSNSRIFRAREDRLIRKFIRLRQYGARLLAPLF